MKTFIAATVLFASTAVAVAVANREPKHPVEPAPAILSSGAPVAPPMAVDPYVMNINQPVIDVVFALDTTGSMGGMIETAKQKIWSIASTMANANTTPKIRMGLVAYRDRGEAFVTQVTDLSDDLDSVYGKLMDYQAVGGGDTPESVHAALNSAVHQMKWSEDPSAYKVVFLVGDAPGHKQNTARISDTIKAANRMGIHVNTIQCGDMRQTAAQWKSIAALAQGKYFSVEQNGGAIAMTTPYDAELADLARQLDATRLYYGDKETQAKKAEKRKATAKAYASAPVASLARRAEFNASAGGRANQFGDKDLVGAVESGLVSVDKLKQDGKLPAPLAALEEEEVLALVKESSEKRQTVSAAMANLARQRKAWIKEEVAKKDTAGDSLEAQLFKTIREQASEKGLEYTDDAIRY